MPPNIRVCVNGFVLSTLLFDCANNSGDQEGFLYGSITRNVRREINDQSMSGTQEDILISICSSVPCGGVLSFYNNTAQINRDDLEFNLGERKKNIVGWYRYRRYSAMYPSVRETAIHQNLRGIFGRDMEMGSQYFVYAVLSSSNLPNFATHSYDYAFFTQRPNNSFRHLSTTILNLGDTRNSYRAGSMALPFMDSSSFNSVISNSWNFSSFFEIEDQIQHFHQKLRSKLESLQEELAASDAVNGALEEDIRRLSNELQTLLAAQEQMTSTASQSSIAARESDNSDSGTRPSSGVKRAAVEPIVRPPSIKRMCRDKYFESEEYEETSTDEVITDSTDVVTSEISSSKYKDEVESRAMVVDPDNGETSSVSQNEAESNLKSESDAADVKDVNTVPSPSSTVEVVISDTGLQTFYIGTDSEGFRSYSSAESSDIKETSSDQVSSPKEVDTSNLVTQMNVSSDTELQSETVSSAVNDPGDNSVDFESNLALASSTVITRASSSSDELSKKMIPPFIIYASKEPDDPSKDPAPSSSTEKCQELSNTKHESSEDKSSSPCEEIEQEVTCSPVVSEDQEDEKESDLGKSNK